MNKTILQNHDSSNILLHRCHEGNETFKTVLDGNAKFYSQVVQLGYTHTGIHSSEDRTERFG